MRLVVAVDCLILRIANALGYRVSCVKFPLKSVRLHPIYLLSDVAEESVIGVHLRRMHLQFLHLKAFFGSERVLRRLSLRRRVFFRAYAVQTRSDLVAYALQDHRAAFALHFVHD